MFCFNVDPLDMVHPLLYVTAGYSPYATRAEEEADQLNQVGSMLVPKLVHSGSLPAILVHVEQCIRRVVSLRIVDLTQIIGVYCIMLSFRLPSINMQGTVRSNTEQMFCQEYLSTGYPLGEDVAQYLTQQVHRISPGFIQSVRMELGQRATGRGVPGMIDTNFFSEAPNLLRSSLREKKLID